MALEGQEESTGRGHGLPLRSSPSTRKHREPISRPAAAQMKRRRAALDAGLGTDYVVPARNVITVTENSLPSLASCYNAKTPKIATGPRSCLCSGGCSALGGYSLAVDGPRGGDQGFMKPLPLSEWGQQQPQVPDGMEGDLEGEAQLRSQASRYRSG